MREIQDCKGKGNTRRVERRKAKKESRIHAPSKRCNDTMAKAGIEI